MQTMRTKNKERNQGRRHGRKYATVADRSSRVKDIESLTDCLTLHKDSKNKKPGGLR